MDTTIIHHTSIFNHGCQDWAEVTNGIVTKINSCRSCWQVGHTSDREFLQLGDKIKINSVDQYGESEDWELLS